MFSVTPIMTNEQIEKDTLHGLLTRHIWIFWIISCWDTWTFLWVQLLMSPRRHFTISLWMTVRLSVTTPASLNEYRGPWWDLLRRPLNLIEDISALIINVFFQQCLNN
jgi:hypothetical protein